MVIPLFMRITGRILQCNLLCLPTANLVCSTRLRTNFAKNDNKSFLTLVASLMFKSRYPGKPKKRNHLKW